MAIDIELTPREQTPRWLAYGTPVFTILAALVVSGAALVSIGVNPITAYNVMFVQTLTSQFGLSETLIRAVPLILTGIGVYLPMKAGLWNIGAEGQMFMGAIAGTWIGLNVALPQYALIPTIFVGAGIAGGVWAAIPAYLRAKWGVNEIITTLLFTFIAGDIKNFLVRGPMQGGHGGFAQTGVLSAAAAFPSIPWINVHIGLVMALLVAVGTAVLMQQTRFGFQITFVGSNADAAEQAGMSKYRVFLFVLITGGIFAALGGISEIAGNQGRLRASFAPGYGFTAVPIALLGRNGPFRVVLAAVFFALMFVGGDSLSVAMNVPSALIEIIQALVILFLITAEFFKQYTVDIRFGRQRDRQSAAGTEVASDG